MAVPCKSEAVALTGPAGSLQARLSCPESVSASGVCVVCHPHPLHGGTMDNKVVQFLAKAALEAGAPALRFNFRGVGASAGTYDRGVGELEDLRAAVQWVRRQWPERELWLAGFSFGAGVAYRFAAAGEGERLITVAPPVRRMGLDALGTPQCLWLVIQGDADEVVAPGEVLDWARSRDPAPRIEVLAGAGHFFHKRLAELRERCVAWLATDAPAPPAA